MIITWDNAAEKASGMRALGQAIATRHTQVWGDDVAKKGEDTIREVIQAGGMNPTKKGGPRILSGAMIGAVDSENIVGGGVANIVSGIGAKSSAPFYSVFQEGGTSRGITAMMAIPMAQLEMSTEIENAGERMLRATQAEWNAI